VKARVLEELSVVGEPDEGVLRSAESCIGEGQAQAVEERVQAKGDEEREPGQEKEVGSQRTSASAPPQL
jgi:hypothetical protein